MTLTADLTPEDMPPEPAKYVNVSLPAWPGSVIGQLRREDIYEDLL